ncbi:hypothetical protein Tco_0510596 [Tanacetum coccineum]
MSHILFYCCDRNEEELDSEFNKRGKHNLRVADTQAEIFLSQGLPRLILSNINSIRQAMARRFRNNVEYLCKDPGRLYNNGRMICLMTIMRDAYDSDVDEGPNAAVAFMANLSSTRYALGRTFRLDAELR